MKMSEDERQCLSESRGGLLMSFLFLVIARVAITQFPGSAQITPWLLYYGNSFPTDAPGAATQGDSAVEVSEGRTPRVLS